MGQEPPIQPPTTPPPAGTFASDATTSEGQPLAEWWKRLVAAIIDGLIISIPAYILMGVFSFGMKATPEFDPATGAIVGAGMIASMIGTGLVLFLLGIAYYVYFHGSTGQTLGKKAMKIKVVDEATGAVIGYGRAFLRWAVALGLTMLCYIPGIIDGLWPLFDKKRQSFHDKAVKSVVIDLA